MKGHSGKLMDSRGIVTDKSMNITIWITILVMSVDSRSYIQLLRDTCYEPREVNQLCYLDGPALFEVPWRSRRNTTAQWSSFPINFAFLGAASISRDDQLVTSGPTDSHKMQCLIIMLCFNMANVAYPIFGQAQAWMQTHDFLQVFPHPYTSPLSPISKQPTLASSFQKSVIVRWTLFNQVWPINDFPSPSSIFMNQPTKHLLQPEVGKNPPEPGKLSIEVIIKIQIGERVHIAPARGRKQLL